MEREDTRSVSAKMRISEVERIDERAEEAGLSRAEYFRQRLRAGELLWSSGELDGELLTALAEDGDVQSVLETTDQVTNNSSSPNSYPASPHQDLTNIVLQNIPHKRSDDAISDDELMEVVFGDKNEQKKALNEVITQLYGDKIERTPTGKLVKTGDEDEQ